ncbi:MAG TPA: hypothetical protein PK536_10060, partial [Ignavibacteria bacterium]|nr:hypothetical protein [Ignavibacteria bacterium]
MKSKEQLALRTYNQVHIPRKYEKGKRRISVYISWSYPGESNRNPAELDNRFSTMTEVKKVLWPDYEWADLSSFLQGISGSLELFFVAWVYFQEFCGEVSGYPVPVYQRIDQAGYKLPIDERILEDTDTLFIFGLDHMITDQEASAGEIEAIENFLKREGTCLVIGPHHDVGISDDLKLRQMEYLHHGDALVPRQQRFGKYTRSILNGLGIPVENKYGLRPAVVKGTNKVAPFTPNRDLDTKGWLKGVTSFNFHMHLPHYEITKNDGSINLLATQPIDLSNPHPFTEAGNTEFNSFIWIKPDGKRAGDVLIADSTIFSTLFGADESLENF